jgi:hypothetical protein
MSAAEGRIQQTPLCSGEPSYLQEPLTLLQVGDDPLLQFPSKNGPAFSAALPHVLNSDASTLTRFPPLPDQGSRPPDKGSQILSVVSISQKYFTQPLRCGERFPTQTSLLSKA